MPKYIKIHYVCQSYSKPKVGRFLSTRCSYFVSVCVWVGKWKWFCIASGCGQETASFGSRERRRVSATDWCWQLVR